MSIQRHGDGSLQWIKIFVLTVGGILLFQLVVAADIFGSFSTSPIKISEMNLNNSAVTMNDHGMTITNSHNAAVTVNERGIGVSNVHDAAITVNDDGITIFFRTSTNSSDTKDPRKQERREDPSPKEATHKEDSIPGDEEKEKSGEVKNSVTPDGKEEAEKEKIVEADEEKEEPWEEKKTSAPEGEEGLYKNFGTIHYEIRNNIGELNIGKYINYGVIHVNLHDNIGTVFVRIRNGDEKARVFIHCHRNRGTITVVKDPMGRTELQTITNNQGQIKERKMKHKDDNEFKGKAVVEEFYGTRTISQDMHQQLVENIFVSLLGYFQS